jgi:transcriptional regulator GlxA family with amidase domain
VTDNNPLRVALVATPEAQISPLSGLFETLNAFGLLEHFEPSVPKRPFAVEIAAPPDEGSVGSAGGLRLGAHRAYEEIADADIVILPLMMLDGPEWVTGRYPGLVQWLREMHEAGAMLCSACTGVLLLAETGLLRGREATIHWAFASTFRRNFPDVQLRTDEALITTGDRRELVMTGGVTSWHDLALQLIARHVGPTAAQAMAKLMMLHWHTEGQAPYVVFSPTREHGDGLVLRLQVWLDGNFAVASPVEEMVHMAGVPRRSMERRFAKATGLTPLAYVQALRIEEAKRRLERTQAPVDEIGCQVGYENSAFFRRLFKRSTRMTPGAYRRKFRMPQFAPSA